MEKSIGFYHNNNDDKDDKHFANGYGANSVLKYCFLVKLLMKKDIFKKLAMQPSTVVEIVIKTVSINNFQFRRSKHSATDCYSMSPLSTIRDKGIEY